MLDAVTFHAFVIQPLADYDTDVLQAAVADSRGKALSAGKKCLVQSAATWGMWMMQALKLMQDLNPIIIILAFLRYGSKNHSIRISFSINAH